MPVVFTDDFNRANGPPGAGWTVQSGTWAIDGNMLKSSVAGIIRSNTAPAGANVCCFLQVPAYGGSVRTYAFRLRQSADFTYYALVQFSLNATNIVVTIAEATGGGQNTLATRTIAYSPGVSTFLMATASGDKLSGNVDSNDVLHVKSDAAVYQGTCAIVTSYSNTTVDDWWQYDLETDAWTISADAVEEIPGRYHVTLHNPAADWVAGIPGTPTFTCQAGTIVDQEVVDSETAKLTYDAPELKALEVFQDDYNGVTFPLVITNPAGASGTGEGGAGLTEQEHEILLKLETEVDQYLLEKVIYTDPWATLMGAAWWILGHDLEGQTYNFGDLVAAVLADDGSIATLLERVGLARDDIAALAGGEGYNLAGVQEAIRGAASRDLTAVYNLVAALPDPSTALTTIQNILWEIRTVAHSYTLESVVDAIAAARGAGNPDIAAVLTAIGNIPGADNQEVLDAIAAVRGTGSPDLASVLAAIAAVRGTGSPDIAAVLSAISAIDTSNDTAALAAIAAAIALIPTDPVHDVIEDLDAITSAISAVASAVSAVAAIVAALNRPVQTAKAPVWPGLANVAFGTPVSLDGGVTIEATMHGVVIELSTVPAETDRYMFDAEASYLHVGQVAFANDDGAFDAFQPFSFGKQVLCPLRMSSASKVVVRSALGVGGTVTPWTITTPA